MVLCCARLGVQEWHPQTPLNAQSRVVRFTTLENLLVRGIIEKEIFNLQDRRHFKAEQHNIKL